LIKNLKTLWVIPKKRGISHFFERKLRIILELKITIAMTAADPILMDGDNDGVFIKEWGDFNKNHRCQALKQSSLTCIKPEFFHRAKSCPANLSLRRQMWILSRPMSPSSVPVAVACVPQSP
jgi:hypothetical protein